MGTWQNVIEAHRTYCSQVIENFPFPPHGIRRRALESVQQGLTYPDLHEKEALGN